MSTLGTMKTRIADEIARTDLTSQIALCITSAIEEHERFGWWFQETSFSFDLTSGQTQYTTSDNANIPLMIDFDSVTVTGSGSDPGWGLKLEKWPYSAIQARLQSNAETLPSVYSFWEESLWFAPEPGSGYAVKVAGKKKLTTLSESTDTNAWMVTGEILIRQTAKRMLYEDYIHDAGPGMIDRLERAVSRAHKKLLLEHKMRVGERPAVMSELARMSGQRGAYYDINSGTFGGL